LYKKINALRNILIEIDFINGRRTDHVFGVSKYNTEIFRRITGAHLNKIEYPQIGTSRYMDGAIKRTIYPVIVKSKVHEKRIKHVTNPDMAFLLVLMGLSPSIVTCYDLIPVSYYNNRSLYWKLNLRGLQKADHILTISEFSKNEIIRLTGISGDKISVIYPGVDMAHYYPKPDRSILSQYSITDNDQIIMYLGSEEPRKNISLILKAIYHLKKSNPRVKLLKVGGAQMGGDRQAVLKLIKDLHLENEVLFTGQVAESDLPKYYNAADLFVFPSYYEGFGLPPLEAMACGCPVIVADRTSLPEVVGDAGSCIDPDDELGVSDAMAQLLSGSDKRDRNNLIARGLEQAAKFSWDVSARQTMDLYKCVLSESRP
jgi:glycosyltransferase involved in cell wall biosynthesis